MSKMKNAIEWHCLNCDKHGAGDYYMVHNCYDYNTIDMMVSDE